MFYICSKFPENISKGFRVIEPTRFETDRRADNHGKNNVSPGMCPQNNDNILLKIATVTLT